MVEYNLDWLKAKGFFKKSIPLEADGKKVLVDNKSLLAYVEVSYNEEIKKIKRELSSQKVRYIWFFFPITGRLKVFRKVGEVKWFYYSAKMRSDYLKSRIDKLNTFSLGNMNILFDIRDIVDRFYWQLWEYRRLMAGGIKKLREDKNKLLVVQHLMDRLIFFYFLSQLKLVKIKNEKREWILDRKNTREFFRWICSMLSEKHLQEFLNKIFFDVLGQVNESGRSSLQFNVKGEKFTVVSPCLNGGLFLEQDIEGFPERKIEIGGIKKLILKVLNRYNWIIGEESPEEEDVIGDLTPEIIGHIYEKFVISLEQIGIGKIKLQDVRAVKEELIYGRKKIGAYYTPEEITNYISRNTIYPCIRGKLKEKFGRQAIIDNLFKKDGFNEKELGIIRHLYFEILTKMKICDDACGSGSFLIAAGDVLLGLYSRLLKILEENLSLDEDVRKILDEIRKSPSRDYYIVRQIIVNNLYGVDMMEGAIEIAKLRFWLWLISHFDPKKVEGKRIETLPNLDFNLIVGNSLIGFIDIGDVEFDYIKLKPKKRWKTLADKQILITTYLSKEKIELLKKLAKEKKKFKTLPAHEAMKLKKKLEGELEKARGFLNKKFYDKLKVEGIEVSYREFLNLAPFHWGFEFYEVFDLEKPKEERGFDVIIGNPPYIDSETMVRIIPKQRQIFADRYTTAKGNWDLYIPFYELTYKISNKDSIISYITPNKWLSIRYGKKLRELFNKKLSQICDCSEVNVFVEVGNSPVITFIRNEDTYDEIKVHSFTEDYALVKRQKVPRSILDFGNWGILLSKYIDILLKIFNKEERVSNICDVENPFTVSEAYKLKEYLFDGKSIKKGSNLKLINTGTIDKYESLWGVKQTSYIKKKYLYPFVKIKPFRRGMPKRYNQSISKKIIISGIRHFECFLDAKGEYVAGKSTIIIRNCRNNMSLEFIISILNSKTIAFYIKQAYGALGIEGGINFTAPMVASLPLPKVSKKDYNYLTSLVNKIEAITKDKDYFKDMEKQNVVEELKKKIDGFVYKLYGITDRERKIIEESSK